MLLVHHGMIVLTRTVKKENKGMLRTEGVMTSAIIRIA